MACSWCGHRQCKNCNEELNRLFSGLFFGCHICGEQAQLDAYNLIEGKEVKTYGDS